MIPLRGDLQSGVLEGSLGHGEVGGRRLNGDLVGGGVDLEQEIPPANKLVVFDREFPDRTRNPGCDPDHVGHEHAVVAAGIAGIPDVGDDRGDDRQDHKTPAHQGADPGLREVAVGCVFSQSGGVDLLFGGHGGQWVKKIR